jgi:hypothetical protein
VIEEVMYLAVHVLLVLDWSFVDLIELTSL